MHIAMFSVGTRVEMPAEDRRPVDLCTKGLAKGLVRVLGARGLGTESWFQTNYVVRRWPGQTGNPRAGPGTPFPVPGRIGKRGPPDSRFPADSESGIGNRESPGPRAGFP
jgi:hypothetical protein